MRYWNRMVAGGAAMLISAGAAHAVQDSSAVARAVRPTTSARQETSWDANGGAASEPARAKTDAAGSGDGSGYVTHDELDRFSRELIERVERERNAQTPEPTFTDAG